MAEVLPEFAALDDLSKWLYPKLEMAARGEGYADLQQFMQAHGHWWWSQDAVYAAKYLSDVARKQRAEAQRGPKRRWRQRISGNK
jgi:virulence-associated protein VapD